jgi:hypothetical protein
MLLLLNTKHFDIWMAELMATVDIDIFVLHQMEFYRHCHHHRRKIDSWNMNHLFALQ